MNEATIITFANQKGGVGKTTLCTLFANYLVARGKRTIVIDCDGQQTIFEKRKADHKKYSDLKEPYKVQAKFGIVTPKIEQRVEMQRYNTVSLRKKNKPCKRGKAAYKRGGRY